MVTLGCKVNMSEVNMRLLRWCSLAVLSVFFAEQSVAQSPKELDLASPDALQLHGVKAKPITYLGHPAMRIEDSGEPDLDDAHRLAVVRGSSFQDGVIEVDLSGGAAPDAPPDV